jgi:7,8-dihydropterin-6-yl-methyl-4-(beta-D-ribofuranosyl)aminobenzene 5'-phosphate synthase
LPILNADPAPKEVNMRFRTSFRIASLLLFLVPCLCMAQSANLFTILYDAFGKSPALTKDWAFSALIEHGGKTILFDTGNNAEIFAANVKATGVDPRKLDFVVISHRHDDHASGLTYLLSVNPTVKIYTPDELFGLFGRGVPNEFYRKDDSLPFDMRYFGGAPSKELSAGSPWAHANFVPVSATIEVAPGIFLIPTISQTPGTLELREVSLAIRSPEGLIVVDGCSHAGVEKILEAATKIDPHVYILFGGLHLVRASDSEIVRITGALHDQWKLDFIAPGHCTGEPTFAALQKAFGDRYIYAGLGTVVNIPNRRS